MRRGGVEALESLEPGRLDRMVERLSMECSKSREIRIWSERDGWRGVAGRLAEEQAVSILLDGSELATLMCTPEKVSFLVVGFLRSEGLIERLDDLAMVRVCPEDPVVDVRLMRPRQLPEKRILTSGCGQGLTFDDGLSLHPVSSDLRMTPARLLECMRMLQQQSGQPGEGAGMHVSALSEGESLLVVSRDVGRHNTLDKIWGECLFRGISTDSRLLLSTGRLSSEMIVKAAKMGVPVVASLNSPTSRAVLLADVLGMTVVGYARGGRISVYSHPERLCPASQL